MKKILVIGLVTILLVYFGVAGFFAFRQEVPKSKVGSLQSITTDPTPNSKGIVDLTLIMSGGSLNLSSSGSSATSVEIETNVRDWLPHQTTTAEGLRVEQLNRPRDNWQKVDYTVNNWLINAWQDPMDLKIDARIWDGELNLSGIDLRSFQLADLNSQSVIRFDQPGNLFDTFVIDSVRSNMKLLGILNSGAKNVILKVPFGNYLLDFSGKLQQDMSAVITTGMGKTRIEIADSANVQITYTGQTRKATIEGDWSRIEGTTYVHPNPGYLLDIVVNSDQGDLEVVIIK